MEIIETSSAKHPKILTCFHYPGRIDSVPNMLKTLGGLDNIAEAVNDCNRRIELNFRPNDPFCRPTCGQNTTAYGLLFKITRKRKKAKYAKIGDKIHEHSELTGIIKVKYLFEDLSDFQFLPMANKGGVYSPLAELIPQFLAPSNILKEEVPLFLLPPMFSRLNTPQEYYFRNDAKVQQKQHMNERKDSYLPIARLTRKHHAIIVSITDDIMPTSPKPSAHKHLQKTNKKLIQDSLPKLKEIFKDRPIWSKNALKGKFSYNTEKLKIILPCVAYHYRNGPFCRLWIRFGYDPRKDHTAWIYQSFDFRVRRIDNNVRIMIKAKRGTDNYSLPYRTSNLCRKRKSPIIIDKSSEDTVNQEETAESLYVFRKKTIPPYRQMLYQYCDIDVPEVQKLLEQAILSSTSVFSTEKNGWLPVGTDSKIRDIIAKDVEITLNERNIQDDDIESEDSDDIELA